MVSRYSLKANVVAELNVVVASQGEKTTGDVILQIVGYIFCTFFGLLGRYYYNQVG